MSEIPPYSPARATQLRYVLVAAVVVGVLLLLMGVFVPVALVPAVLVLASSGLALRLLQGGRRSARWAAVGAGVVQVLLGVWMARSGLGLIPSVVGVLLLLLALLPEADGAGSRSADA